MKGVFVGFFCLVVYFGICSAKDCTGNRDCLNSCANDYHEQCVSGMCQCPDHTCTTTADCPTGNESGCPPGEAKCSNGKCQCTN